MAPSRYALAQDDDGRTMWRVREDMPHDHVFELIAPDGSLTKVTIWVTGDDSGATQIMNIDWESDERMPRSWVLWLAREVYGADLLNSRNIGRMTKPMVPLPLDAFAWDDIDLHLEAEGIRQLSERIIEGDRAAFVQMKSLLTQALEWMNLDTQPHHDGSFSTVAAFHLMNGYSEVGKLNVFRRGHDDGSISVGYHLYRPTLPKSDENRSIFADSLSEALAKAELWLPIRERHAWVEEHTEDPVWLFDPDILEAYDLLGTPSPLGQEWESFAVWAEANGLTSST